MKKIIFWCTVLFLLFHVSVYSQYEDTGKRGVYFSKKVYTDAGIPGFDKKLLPLPILDDNQEWLDLYWKAWELAFKHYKKPPHGSPFVSNYIDEAFSQSVFQWDTIFMIMFARYAHFTFPAIQSLDNFYSRQYENGYICREIQEADGQDFVYEGREHTVNPPLFSWAEMENYKITGDQSRFRAVLPVLEKYTAWLEKYRKKENTLHDLYWQTGLGSGMDNAPRRGSAWTDMSCQMVMMYKDMAEMANRIGENQKAKQFRDQGEKIAVKINRLMWNEEDGLYYDLDDNGTQIKSKTVGCFWPLLAGIASDKQAERLFNNLKDPKQFWRVIPFPSLAADQPGYKADGQYWLGSVWAPTNVAILQGLTKYGHLPGFTEFATLAAETYIDAMYKVFRRTGTIWENYSPEAFARGIQSKPDFVGWSGCGPIELLIENVLGFLPDGAGNRLVWNISRVDRHGIENLRFGNLTVSAICLKRGSVISPIELDIETNKSMELKIVFGLDKSKLFKLDAGKHHLSINEQEN